MAHFWKLYKQELRKISVLFLIVLIAFFSVSGIFYFVYVDKHEMNVFFASLLMLGIMFIAPPVLLAFSFRKDKEHLEFSLPMRRSSIFLSRYLAALAMFAVAIISATLWAIFVFVPLNLQQMEQSCIRGGYTEFSRMIPYYNDLWGFLFHESNYFFFTRIILLFSFVTLGIVAFTRSLRYIFRRFSKFLSNLLALILFIAFCWLGLRYLRPMGIGHESIIISLITGLVFFAVGLFLFEKYGEV